MQPRPTGSKSRPQARKRANADDSAFIGPSGSSSGKRGGEKPEGVQERAKRRRAEPASSSKRTEKTVDEIDPSELNVDFHSLPPERLRRYLLQVEAMPMLHPSPCSTDNPPLPSSLLNTQAVAVRMPSPVPAAGRVRRDVREGQQLDQQQRRRSSRLQEEDARNRRAPILADAEAVNDVLATLAARHFEKQTVNEMEALQQFLFTLKTRF